MANFSGAAQGFLNYDRSQQERDKAALNADYMRAIMAQMQQAQQGHQAVQNAQRNWGSVLQGMMGAPSGQVPLPPGMSPTPGTPQGGPLPPGVGVASQPATPQGQMPAPPGVQFQNPDAGGASLDLPGMDPAQAQALMQRIQNPAQKAEALAALQQSQQVQPYKPMPTEAPPQPTPSAGSVPPPPAMQSGADTGGQQFGLPKILEGLKRANIPPEQWANMLDTLPEPIKNDAANQIKTLQQQQKMLLDWARQQTSERRLDINEKQGQQKIDIAQQKVDRLLAGDTAVQFDDNDRKYWTEVMQNGGTLPAGLARSESGRAFVQSLMHDLAAGDVKPKEMLSHQAEFMGEKAGQRTLGTRSANIEMAATEAASLADLAKTASSKVDRTGVKSLNQAMQAVQKGTSSPELRAFVASNTSLINAYARAINPQGVGTVADKEHAREMLDTAFSKGDYDATVDQLLLEIEAAKASPGSVKGEMRDRFVGGGAKSTVGGAVVPARGTVQDGYRFKGGDPAKPESWEKVN